MIYLDTHVVVWMYAGLMDQLSPAVKELVNADELRISPIVRLEMQYLYEIERVRADADTILADLNSRIDLEICDRDFNSVVSQAMAISWTRDPFDRLIVANAGLHGDILISKDKNIRANYFHTRW